jgi:hypothetical protein
MNQLNQPKYTVIRKSDNVVIIQGNDSLLLNLMFNPGEYSIITNW